jgi:drug/metabolite transporter (DMT)-like permease
VATVALILVVCSGLMNATWNLFTKRSVNKVVFLWSIHIVAAIMYMPTFIIELTTKPIGGTGYALIAASMVFQGMYIYLLAKAYSIGDLSQVYPIMRGTGAMLVPMISVLFMNEHMSGIAWTGLAVLLLGIVALSGWGRRTGTNREVVSREIILTTFAIGLCITGYTLTDKLALEHISPLALIQVSHIGYIIVLTWSAVRSKQMREEWSTNWKTILLGAIMAPGSYLLFLFAMELAQVAQLAPIREIGIVFGTLFGILLLKEKQGRSRIIASVLIVIGVVLIKG